MVEPDYEFSVGPTIDKQSSRKTDKKIKEGFEKAGKQSGKSFTKGFKDGTESSLGAIDSTLSNIKSKIIAFGASVASAFAFKKTTSDAIEFENALVGLQSVARNVGVSFNDVSDAVKEFSADGAISVADVSASLKNLLLNFRELDDPLKASLDTFEAFRDAAAFNRQGQLQLGEAIRGASEGLKNDLSIKTDNAGLTKNISNIQKEYAASIGTTIKKLTDAQKAQAEYTGFIKEAIPFQGDYNKSLDTFGGLVAKATGNLKFISVELGKTTTQSQLIRIAFERIVDAIVKFREELGKNTAKNIKQTEESLISLARILVDVVAPTVEQAANLFAVGFRTIALGANIIGRFFFRAFQNATTVLRELGKAVIQAGKNIGNNLKAIFTFSFDEIRATFDGFDSSELLKSISFKDEDIESILATNQLLQDSLAGITNFEISSSLQENVDAIINAYRRLSNETASTANSVNKNNNSITKGLARNAKAIQAITSTLQSGISASIQAVGAAFVTGDNFLKAFLATAIDAFGNLLIAIGTTAITVGSAAEAIRNSIIFLFGGSAIVAGIAAIGTGAALKAYAASFSASAGSSAPTAGASTGGGATGDDLTAEPIEEAERQTQTSVVVNVQGDILDSQESGLRIVELINEAVDGDGVTIRRQALA